MRPRPNGDQTLGQCADPGLGNRSILISISARLISLLFLGEAEHPEPTIEITSLRACSPSRMAAVVAATAKAWNVRKARYSGDSMGRVGVLSHLRFSLGSSVLCRIFLSQILSLTYDFLLLSFDSWIVNLMRSFSLSVF